VIIHKTPIASAIQSRKMLKIYSFIEDRVMSHETEPSASPPPQPNKLRFDKVAITIITALIVTIPIAVIRTIYFVNSERQRYIQAWQIRLGIIAGSRTTADNEWVEQNFHIYENWCSRY